MRRLLDLFCGAGGAAMGYAHAGWDVTGVDIAPQPRYPFPFVQADALEYAAQHGHQYDAIHASPPCQAYSVIGHMATTHSRVDLLQPTADLLCEIGRPFAIENVTGAKLPTLWGIQLCGLMFGLGLFRHRWFWSNQLLFVPEHPLHRGYRVGVNGMVCMIGHDGCGSEPADHRTKAAWQRASGIDWMTKPEMAQAIPPAYTQWVGQQLLRSGV
jgi:DNA (cytosine-5)-methyltransferase 1